MNLLLLEPGEVPGERDAPATRGGPPGVARRVVLSGRRARHVCRVLRARPGDRLRVGMLRGPRGTAEVVRVAPSAGGGGSARDGRDAGGAGGADEVELLVTMDRPASARPTVDLVLALPRPKVVGRALQTAAALGVGRVDLVNAWRVDKSYFATARLAPDVLRAELVAGCEQGATTWLPEVAVHRLLMPFVRGVLARRMCTPAGHLDDPGAAGPADDPGAAGIERVVGVIAHPRADARLEDVVSPGETAPVIAAIGPERGWIDRELDSFARLGVTPVRLGERVLRVDTAIAALLAQIALLRRLPARQ